MAFSDTAAAFAALPSTIKVGFFIFKLEGWAAAQAAANRRYGEFSSLEETIRLATAMSTPRKLAMTLLHEVLHAAWWFMDVQDEYKEEPTVSQLGAGLTLLFCDNPWLLPWLAEALA